MEKKAIVIGAGIGGLAAAVRLSCAGYSVTVFESNGFIGGKINSENHNGYRFDMGPSVFTGPNYIKELYELCGKDFSGFEYQQLKHSFTYFYPDKTIFTLTNNRKEQVETLSTAFNENPVAVDKYLTKTEKNYDLIAPLFIEDALNWKTTLKNSKLFKALANLGSYKLGKTMHAENSQFNNPKTVQFFNRFATYNGSDPYQAPAMLNMIAHLELNKGAFLPKNGMQQITQSVYELALEKGVVFHLNEKVTSILNENNTVIGVETINGKYSSEVIFSNMDVAFTYEKLMSKVEKPAKILEQEKSSSAVVFYWGINKAFSQLGVHNILFASDYKAEFASIFKDKIPYFDPTIYINITSKEIKTDAPDGCENWFVMINAPSNTTLDWNTVAKEVRATLVEKINKTFNVNIETMIETETVMHPTIIEQKYSGKNGSIYGNASNNKFAAFYRHANSSKNVKGLYFVGVTVHPGGGIPLALNSAKIAMKELELNSKN